MKKINMLTALFLSVLIALTFTGCSLMEKPNSEKKAKQEENIYISTDDDSNEGNEEKKEKKETKENTEVVESTEAEQKETAKATYWNSVSINFMNHKMTVQEKDTNTTAVINRFTKYLISYEFKRDNYFLTLYSLSDGNYLYTNSISGTDEFYFLPYYGVSADEMVKNTRIPGLTLAESLNNCGSKVLYEVTEKDDKKEDHYIFIEQEGWTVSDSKKEKKWSNDKNDGKLEYSDAAGNPVFTNCSKTYSIYTENNSTNITRIEYANEENKAYTIKFEDAEALSIPEVSVPATQLTEDEFNTKLDMALSIFQYDNPTKK